MVGPDARILYVNEYACRGLGYSRDELLSMTVPDLDPNFPHSEWGDHWKQLKKEGFMHFESQHRRKNGTLVPMEISINYLSFGGREYNIAFIRDISERKRSEAELLNLKRQKELILESAGDGIFGMDSNGNHILANSAGAKMLGYTPEEMMGQYSHSLWHHTKADGNPYPPDECLIYKTRCDGISRSVDDEIFWKKDGTSIPVEYVTTPIFEGDSIVGSVVSFRDITERRKAEEALRESEERLALAQKAGRVGVFDWDMISGKVVWTEQLYEMFGLLPGSFEETYEGWAKHVHPDDLPGIEKRLRDWQEAHTRQIEFIYRVVMPDHYVRWMSITANISYLEDGTPARMIGTNIDITDRKEMEDEIRHMAHHDSLTGLPNRRLFNEIANVELAQAARNKKKLAILFLDLDRFKEINDTLGHHAGDQLLMEVAYNIKSSIRKSDTVARIGGDEFNVILADIQNLENISVIARKLTDSFRKPFEVSDHELYITTSIGISVYPDDGDNVDTLLRYADVAMYHAKEGGRNNYQFYNPSINKRSIERMRMEGNLRQAIERNELSVYYQPQIDIISGKMICAEALVRWNHPEEGLLEPKNFLPLAEETGLITSIDQWVMNSVCKQVRTWVDSGLSPVCITVNLSARQFQSPALVSNISSILDKTGMSPHSLDLEITETTAMSNIERTASHLRELVGMGIHISVDDFGTGYSSLNYLKKLPIEKLKIDQSFIHDIATDADDRAIITAVASMARSMSIKTVAEGVETEEQLSFLRNSQCDEAQGFLFSRPLPVEKFTDLMAAGK
jgi:diguanylate cyclase (GGDEF)-like protein/PAS domain S-box-containing protein